ncbi:MAG: radical SAM protein [Candidatus Eiseniibacteriota bacterium]|nr:MAG: radical SAM protein [Candidatus Eisenbacteria bacterium]
MDILDASRFAAKLVRREISCRLVRPTNALFFITYRCSSRCTTCTMWRRGRSEDELGLDRWKSAVDQCAQAGVRNIEMFGGDALLRPEVLFSLIEHASAQGVACDVVTNGLLLDVEAARQLVLSGTSLVAISIDGVGETHDSVRGVPGAFERALAGLRHLKAARESHSSTPGVPRIAINCTVSRRNVKELEPLVELAEREGPDVLAFEYVGQVSETAIRASAVNGVFPDPYFVVQEESNYLSEEEAGSLKRWIDEKHAASKPTGVVLNTENIDVLDPRQMSAGRLPWKKCYVCRSLVIVDPSGNVLCCPFFSRYYLGNISVEPLSHIWNGDRHRLFVRSQEGKKMAICGECILTLQRNPTFAESLVKRFYQYRRRRRHGDRHAERNDERYFSQGPC